MDGGGTRMGSRSSTRHGPAAVFNGPVRRWRKSWSPLPATTVPLTSSRLQLYRWTPQGTREDTAEEAAARPVKFMPLFVVMERRKEALRRAAEAAARLKKQEQGGADGLKAQEEERVLGSDQNVPEGEWIGKDGESGQQAASFLQVDSKKFPEEVRLCPFLSCMCIGRWRHRLTIIAGTANWSAPKIDSGRRCGNVV